MSRLEIVPGPGTAARFGEVCVWAGPGASEPLVAFLVESARNVGGSTFGGARIADHIGGVLAGRDPEPGVPFACVGPGQAGTTVLLHGAIQAWDGTRWLVPQPQPGWLRTEVHGATPISVSAHGAVPLRPAPGTDLRRGVVPSAGFSLVPEPDPAVATTMIRPPAAEPVAAAPAAEPVAVAPAAGKPPTTRSGQEATVIETTELVDALRQIREGRTETVASTSTPDGGDRPPGTLDLARGGASPLPSLPPVGQPDGPVPGQPVVAGVLCPAGHFNHPAVHACVVCRRPVTTEGGRVSGSRPSLGVLVIDDGGVYRLERSYLIGSDPRSDPTVSGGRVRPLTLGSAPAVAASHAEIRLTGWGVSVIGQDADGVTQVMLPGETNWTTLRPFVAHSLCPGAHIAVGARVVSLISPWPIDEPVS
ncbi:MAG: hypothetical protein M3Y91_01540 [Actinomycetota bacterium]|nr:hypothetical protein [Actinomycetota bacterium]